MQQIQIQRKPRRRVREQQPEPDVATGLSVVAGVRERLLRELGALLAKLDAAIEDASS